MVTIIYYQKTVCAQYEQEGKTIDLSYLLVLCRTSFIQDDCDYHDFDSYKGSGCKNLFK